MSDIRAIVATARPPRAASQFVRSIPFVDYMVFYNGALVTCHSKQTRRHISIPAEISRQITRFIGIRVTQSIISYEVNDAWYTCTPVPDSQSAQLGIRPNDPGPQLVGEEVIRSLSPTKILVLGYNDWREVAGQFGDHVNVIATDGGALIQITHKSASKEEAVRWVLSDIGVHYVTESNDNDGVAVALEKFVL